MRFAMMIWAQGDNIGGRVRPSLTERNDVVRLKVDVPVRV